MDRKEVLKRLFKIKNCYNLDITEHLTSLNKNSEISEDMIEFINKHDYKIEDFMETLSNKEFYKSLKSPKNNFSKIKGLSSMLTHSLIEIEKNGEQKDLIVEELKLDEIISALRSFLILGESNQIDGITEEIKEIINKEGEK